MSGYVLVIARRAIVSIGRTTRGLLRRALKLAELTGQRRGAQVREELLVAGARPRRARLHGVGVDGR